MNASATPLQSINEELQTVNQENRHKVAELSQLSTDLQTLMAATHIATLFLDRRLRILRFTPQIAELFSLRVAARGRPLANFTHRLGYAELLQDVRCVLDELAPIEREVQDDRGRWYLARIQPYRSSEDRISGVVLTLVDLTRRKLSEGALRQSEARYRRLFESMNEGFCLVEGVDDAEGQTKDLLVKEPNPAFMSLLGLTESQDMRLSEIAPAYSCLWQRICLRCFRRHHPPA